MATQDHELFLLCLKNALLNMDLEENYREALKELGCGRC
jgi:hypothetical protein